MNFLILRKQSGNMAIQGQPPIGRKKWLERQKRKEGILAVHHYYTGQLSWPSEETRLSRVCLKYRLSYLR